MRVCVCVLCRLYICTSVFQCVVRAIKNLTKVLIIIIHGDYEDVYSYAQRTDTL